jgi:hypothetical protein
MIKTVLIPTHETITLDLPKEFIGQEVEIIAFTKNEGQNLKLDKTKEIRFTVLNVDGSNYKFNRDDANAR